MKEQKNTITCITSASNPRIKQVIQLQKKRVERAIFEEIYQKLNLLYV